MQLTYTAGKHILLTIPSEDEEEPNIVVKIKFYSYNDGAQLLAQFNRKSGNIMNWYSHLKEMKSTQLSYLGSPQAPIAIEE